MTVAAIGTHYLQTLRLLLIHRHRVNPRMSTERVVSLSDLSRKVATVPRVVRVWYLDII